MNKWDDRFIELAAHIATWSKDPSTKVGAVIVNPNRTILSLGYNGLPRDLKDDQNALLDREYKLARTVHAEMNAILSAPTRPTGCTLYTYPLPPCSNCAAHVIQAGITRVVCPKPAANSRWSESNEIAKEMFRETGIQLDYCR